MRLRLLLGGVLSLLLCFQVSAEGQVHSEILARSSQSWDGGAFRYPAGKPELVVQKLDIRVAGEPLQLAVHCHGVPLAAYVLKGSVQVLKEDGQSRTFHAGEGLIEVVDQWHRGIFVEDSQLLVFYASAEGRSLSDKKGAEAGCP